MRAVDKRLQYQEKGRPQPAYGVNACFLWQALRTRLIDLLRTNLKMSALGH